MFSRIMKPTLKLICILLAFYYSIIQVERFFRNEDSSQISFRPFNEGPNDQYPEITFCIGNGAQFNDTVNKFGCRKVYKISIKFFRFHNEK